MTADEARSAAATLFKVLGSESRLQLLQLLAGDPMPVTALATQTGMSQPLVSQHLRNLRQVGIVTVSRMGREAHYRLADHHIAHVIEDAIAHVLEEKPSTSELIEETRGEIL